jgi:hypothetical protein
MKMTQVSVTISQTLNLGKKVGAITPRVTLSADLEPGDDPQACATELHSIIAPTWAKHALKELSWVAQRVTDEGKHEFAETTRGSRTQLKSML